MVNMSLVQYFGVKKFVDFPAHSLFSVS